MLVAPLRGAERVCASGNVTLLGADLAAGELLLAAGAGPGDLVLLDLSTHEATFLPGRNRPPVQGGSLAAGPIVAGQPCGDSCVRVVRWRDGAWRQLGETLVADARSVLVETTYDLSGIPWVLFRKSAGEGISHVAAYRARGREWVPEGGGQVVGAGSPFASPSRSSERAVTAGGIEIRAGSGPQRTQETPPIGIDLAESQIYPLPGGSTLLVTVNGDLYEGGAGGWLPIRWRPWRSNGVEDGIGDRHWVEIVPDAGSPDARGILWTDAESERLFLVEWRTKRGWTRVAETSDGIRGANGERFPIRQVLRLRDGRWVLLVGCVAGPEGDSLAYLTFDGRRLTPARVVPIRAR